MKQEGSLALQALVGPCEKVARGVLHYQASLRCCRTALAAERYRLAKNRWPDDLAALSPEFLREVPLDPYDGAPLRYRHTADGVVIYSVGPDGEDNNGTIDDQNPTSKGTDIGFRLYDPSRRRQPPPKADR